MINDVDELLAGVLHKEFGGAFAPAEMPEVVFDVPSEKAAPTVSLRLVEVRENTALRQDPFVTGRRPDGRASKGRSPLRFDLTYALAAHAADARAEHALLTFALGAFLRNPMVEMPKRGEDAEAERMTVAVAQPEDGAPVPQDGGPTIALRVTAPFDPFDLEPVSRVRHVILGMGQGAAPGFLGHPVDARAVSLAATGVVTGPDGKGLPNVLVSVADRLARTTTDEDGRYLLLNVPPGKVELVFERRGFATRRHPHEIVERARLKDMADLDVRMEPVGDAEILAALRDRPASDFPRLIQTEVAQRTSVVGRLRYAEGDAPAAYVPLRLGGQSTVTDSQGVYALTQALSGTPLMAEIPGLGWVEVEDQKVPDVSASSSQADDAPAKPHRRKAAPI